MPFNALATVEVFTPASHQDVLAMVTAIAVLLLTARLFGEVAKRMKQPSVFGELLAGIVLGPSLLGSLFPFLQGLVIPTRPVQGYLLEAISLLGAMFLLLITGLETDLKLIRRHARTALSVSFVGVLVTFVSSFFFATFIPDKLLVAGGERLVFELFFATAMSIASIPVIATVLIDLKFTRRDVGQTIIAAGMSDDTIGWIILSVVAALAVGHAISVVTVLSALGTVLIFLFFSFTFGRWLVKKSLDFAQDQMTGQDRLLTLVVVLTFAWGSISKFLHIEPVLGAFVMGILFSQMPRLPRSVHEKIESITFGIFSPIFFAVAGLKVNILPLLRPDFMMIALVIIVLATVGKVAGTYIGAYYVARQDRWTALSFGAGLNARGAMGIIIATIGLSLNVLTQEMFSMIVLMSLVTSLIAPSSLRWVLRRVKPSEEEMHRLKKEEMAEESAIIRIHRVLVPLRAWQSEKAQMIHSIKSTILKRIGKGANLSLTLLSVAQKGKKSDTLKYLEGTSALFREEQEEKKEMLTKVVENVAPVNAILDEAQKDYDLVILGASELQHDSRHLFSRFIDTIVELAPCMTMVVHAKDARPDWNPKRILVPTTGSADARHATEFAFLMSSSGGSVVDVLNVFEKTQNALHYDIHGDAFKRQLKIARRMVEELRRLGELHGVQTNADVEIGSASPEETILQTARDNGNDLIILGTDLRPASDRLYLGPRVEYILKNSTCPVIILNSV